MILPANDHNWIDTSSKNEKNSCLSINGECLGLNFTLPFADFQPETVDILCQFQGENLEMCLFLPVLFVCRDAFLSLVGESNIFSSDFSTSEAQTNFLRRKQWHDVTAPSNGWIPFWKTPRGELNLLFNYHLNPISHKSEFPDVNMADHTYSFESFSPSELMSDHISVDLELGPSFLHVTGVIFR